jgi:hypothetical protein
MNIHYRIKTRQQIHEDDDKNIETGVFEPAALNTAKTNKNNTTPNSITPKDTRKTQISNTQQTKLKKQ